MKANIYVVRLLFVVLIGMLPALASAMPTPEVEWIVQAGTSSDDVATNVKADGLGGIYITGYTYGDLGASSLGESDVFLSRYDASGTCVWTQQFGTTSYDNASGLVLDGLGHVYVSGCTTGDMTTGGNGSTNDVFLSKYNVDGTHVWTKQTVTGDNERVQSMATDGLGNFYITGIQNPLALDTFLSKYDAAGNLVWTQTWGGLSTDVAVDSENNVYMVGGTGGSIMGDSDMFVRKYDPNGVLIWHNETGISGVDVAYEVVTDDAGDLYITGETQSNFGKSNAILRKYTGDGQLLWSKQWGTEESDRGLGLSIDDAGNLFLVGGTSGELAGTNPNSSMDVFVQKYDSAGILQWTEQIGSVENEESPRISVDNLGNVYFSGYTTGNLVEGAHMGGQDFFLAKITEVPEPSTLLLVLTGVVAFGLTVRRRR